MKSRTLILGLAVGAVVGLVVASVMTYLDWRLNRGGIFHDVQGTDWGIVAATAISWFAPIFVLCSMLALVVLYWFECRE